MGAEESGIRYEIKGVCSIKRRRRNVMIMKVDLKIYKKIQKLIKEG